MKPLQFDLGDIETPETGCVIQARFVFSSGRELVQTTHKTARAAHLIEILLDLKSDEIEFILMDVESTQKALKCL